MSEYPSYECPRCHSTVTERFWGPCHECREQLNASQRNATADIATERFEPSMHVVPNHVATKD